MSGPNNPKAGLPPHRRMRHDRHFVDELAERMGEGIGRMIRITAITSNQDQPRSNLGQLEDLQSSIDVHGILEPLLVRRIDEGKIELVAPSSVPIFPIVSLSVAERDATPGP